MSNVPTNLIPTRVTGLPEYLGSSTLGYLPYIIDGQTYKVQFANIAAVGAVPSTRQINTGSGLGGGGDLSANRTLFILPGGVNDSMLTASGVTAGNYGAADSVPVLTINAQGRVTAATLAPIVLANYVPTSRTITAGAGLTGGGDLSANRSFAVNFSSTTPEPLGPGTSGVSTVAARGDHVHPAVDLSDTTETQGVLPLSRGGTGNSLSPVVGAIAYSSNDKLYLTPTAGDAGQALVSAGGLAPPFWQTVTGLGTVTSVNLTAGTGISVSGGPITTSGSINVVNTAPDQIVSLTGAGTTVVTGTYPNFTITSNDSASGTVTSVAASGGTTGLSFTGSPITTAGTLTLGGTLAVANGGTGATDAATALTNLGAYPASNPSGFTSNVGTVTSVSGTGTVSGLSLSGTVTSTGSLTLGGTLAVLPSNFASQTANTVLAAPNGSAGVPTFRAIVAADIPTLNQNTTGTASNVTGVVAVVNGGTGATTLSSGYLVKGNGTSAVSASVVYDDGTNVGIGTTSPSALLTISRNGGGDIGALVSQTNSGNGTTGHYRATHGSGAAINLEAGNGYTAVKTTSASPLGLYTSDTERFRIASAGQWGIGGANYGTAGQVFTSGGASAAPTWTTPTTGTVTSVGGTGTVNGITLTGTVTSSGSLTLGGTLSGVNLTSQVTGTLPVANGGTNGSATPTAGTVAYGTGTAYAFTSAGTTGQVLLSNNTSAPSWGGIDGGTF